MNFWKETVSIAFEDAGIVATDEQLEIVAEAVRVSHENYGMLHGYDAIPNPLLLEINRLEKALKTECEKITCPACNEKGSITELAFNGCGRSSTGRCWKCNGEGRV